MRWLRQLKSASSGSRMGWTGAVSVMLEVPSGSVSAHASEPLPIRGQAFHSEPWKETEGGGWGGLGGSGIREEKDLGTGRMPPHPSPNICLLTSTVDLTPV